MAGEKGSTYANSVLQLIFNGTTITSLAENASTSPYANLYLSLHTADAGAGGTQATNEVSYTGYARVGVARSTTGFTVTGNSVSPNATTYPSGVAFGQCTAGTATATNWAIGVAATGATEILYSGVISPTINIQAGVTPVLTTSSAVTEV